MLVAGLALGLLAPEVGAQDGGVRRGRVVMRVPGGGQLEAVRVKVAGAAAAVVQDQAGAAPDTLVNVGVARSTEVDLRPGREGIASRGMSESRAIFYLHAQAEAVESFEIVPSFVMVDGNMIASGRTPAVFVVEFLQFSQIGDVAGTVLRRFDGVGFELERPNRFEVQMAADPTRAFGVRLSVDLRLAAGHETMLQIKASREGPYPMNWKTDGAGEAQIRSQPHVRFTYVPSATGGSLVGEDPAADLADQIRRYLAGRRPGTDVEIPLEVELKFR